jgi:hypothetical protein
MTETWYRYRDYCVGDGEGWSEVRIACDAYRVLKYTPKGVWLSLGHSTDKRWVSKSSRKQFACPTKELALESFKARKRRQISIYAGRLGNAKEALEMAKVGEPFKLSLGRILTLERS